MMLVITVTLVPGGIDPLRRTIGSLRIENVSELSDISDYRITAMEAANPLIGSPARIAETTLQGHDRHQSVWAIVQAAADRIEDADWVAL
jgi:hypothetical protein